MRLTHTYSPVDVRTSDLLELNDPDTGTLTLSLRPFPKRPNYVYRDLLTALGKGRDYGARTRSVADDRSNLDAYLRTHGIARIIAVHCEWARPSDEVLDVLLDLVRTHDIDLDLVSELDESTTAVDFVTSAAGRIQDWNPRRFQADPQAIVQSWTFTFPPEVPHVDFPLFRATCRRVLGEADYQTVDNAYTFAYRAARAILAEDVSTADTVAFLRTQMAAVVNPAQATTVLRACQAAAFSNGLLLKLDLLGLGLFIANATHRRLTPDELRLLRRLHTPWKAAAAVLTDAGLSIDQLLELQITDVDSTGAMSDAAVNGRLRDEGRLHLRALRWQRLAEAEAGDRSSRLFTSEDRAIRTALYIARRDLGIPLDISRWRSGAKKDPYEADLNLSLHRLTGEASA